MALSNDELISILSNCPIDGLDYKDGLARFGGQAAIYKRIIKAFVVNIPQNLAPLHERSYDRIEDYIIRVHGLKGSCYGISAMRQGDMAKSLEFAARGDDWEAVERDTPKLIASIEHLIEELQELIDALEGDTLVKDDARPLADAPDKDVLNRLHNAAVHFDIDVIKQAIQEMDDKRYSFDAHLVSDLKNHLMNFRYDLIEDSSKELLERFF